MFYLIPILETGRILRSHGRDVIQIHYIIQIHSLCNMAEGRDYLRLIIVRTTDALLYWYDYQNCTRQNHTINSRDYYQSLSKKNICWQFLCQLFPSNLINIPIIF